MRPPPVPQPEGDGSAPLTPTTPTTPITTTTHGAQQQGIQPGDGLFFGGCNLCTTQSLGSFIRLKSQR